MLEEATPRSKLTTIGGWTLGGTLGKGAYAHVRLATHPNGHKAACKILPALPASGFSYDQMIDAVEAHKEVVLLKALAGSGMAGVVGLEGVMEEGGWTYVFLTLYPKSSSSLPVPMRRKTFVPFFRHLLHTVDALHSLNVSHEDIKRTNILVDEDGRPILVDFGFSHFRPRGGRVKSAGGTLDYSSPEKVADIRYHPAPNDVWALGILLTKLLNIQHPFVFNSDSEESRDVRKQIMHGSPYYCWEGAQLGPGGLAELVEGMLKKDPKSRWSIPRILKHPYLRPISPDPKPFKPPPFLLPSKTALPVSDNVLHDLCFLSYISGEMQLCESPQRIVARLQSPASCWEKRWAGMLSGWEATAELDWVDTAVCSRGLAKYASETPSGFGPKVSKLRVLREIHLSPARPTTSTLRASAGGFPVPQALENAKTPITPTRAPGKSFQETTIKDLSVTLRGPGPKTQRPKPYPLKDLAPATRHVASPVRGIKGGVLRKQATKLSRVVNQPEKGGPSYNDQSDFASNFGSDETETSGDQSGK
ncbi:hypothetical protein P7C73_g2725, partial [Tremellales sp. Uapishka_1]